MFNKSASMISYKISYIYLSTKMEITEQNCRLRTRDDKYKKNQEEKSEHVIHLARPSKNDP